jgi:hypothetical protein
MYVPPKRVNQFAHIDAHIALINRLYGNRDVWPKNLALGTIGSNAVNGGKRIRWKSLPATSGSRSRHRHSAMV